METKKKLRIGDSFDQYHRFIKNLEGVSMQKTKIDYLDWTWNPITMRCTPVSPGCANCWHLAMANRLTANPLIPRDEQLAYADDGDPEKGGPILKERELDAPRHLRKPSRIGLQLMGDLFHEKIDDGFLVEIFRMMLINPQHTYFLLTKRPKRMNDFLSAGLISEADWIWLGVSAEDQKTADERIPILLQIPAAHRWVSIEPMLGSVDLGFDKVTCECCPRWDSRWIRLKGRVTADFPLPLISEQARKMIAPARFYRAESNPHGTLSVNTPGGLLGVKPDEFEVLPKLDWVIAGGETGPRARPLHPDWVRSLRDQCRTAGTPFFFKSWGKWTPLGPPTQRQMVRVGHKKSGHLLDGREWRQLPPEIG